LTTAALTVTRLVLQVAVFMPMVVMDYQVLILMTLRI